MRMRKKKWADPFLEEHRDYIFDDPSAYKGKWHDFFHTEELHVELGMGKGGYLIKMAEMYPKAGWVGVEKDHSAAAVAARKVIDNDLPRENHRMISGNAERLGEWFAEGEIDVLHLNFSDPWPKTYTHKRRLSSSRFLELYRLVLAENGHIEMKTDNQKLFEYSVICFLENGFTLTEISVDYRREEHPEDAVTEYEQKFIDEGKPIYRLCAVRQKECVLQ